MPQFEAPQFEINMYNYCMNSIRLGNYLKSKRLEKGLSRQALATLLNVSLGHINNIERGDRMPSSSLMMAFAKQFGVSTGYLYKLLEDEEPEQPITKPKSRIPDLAPDEPPLSPEEEKYLEDPYGAYLSFPTYSKLSNKQRRVIVNLIKSMLEEDEEDE